MARECPVCGRPELQQKEGDYVFAWPEHFAKRESVFHDAAWEVCAACGEAILPPDLSDRIEEERYHMQGLLTPSEIRQVRDRTGLTQVGMAQLLQVGDKTYARWEVGLSVQHKSMDNIVRAVDSHPELFAEIEAERRPGREERVEGYIRQLPTLKEGNPLAVAAHGQLPPGESIGAIRARLAALLKARDERRDEACT